MTSGESFLLVFAIIYATDCVVWLNQSAYALVSFTRPRFHVRRATVEFAALRGGLAILNPLPPLGTVFVSQAWPIAITREGLAPLSLENPNPGCAVFPQPGAQYLPWEEIKKVSGDQKKLRINGRIFAVFSTRPLCAHFAREIRRLAQLTPDEREAAIENRVRESFSSHRAGRLARWFCGSTSFLRWVCNILFLFAFLLLPFSYWLWGDGPSFLLALGCMWLLMIQVSLFAFFLHRRLFPSLPGERWIHLVFSLFLPQYAIRSIDTISKGLLSSFHPLAIAAAVAPREEFENLASQVWRDATHPITPEEPGPAFEAAQRFHGRFFLPELKAFLESHDFVPANDAGPLPSEIQSVAICPRCLTAFERTDASCEDCGDLPVIPREKEAGG